MPRKIRYSEVAKKYRPYLEVVFCDSITGKCSQKTFGLVDSGADGIVIPYSLGKEIGLRSPTAPELLDPNNIMTGIGGDAWHVARDCKLHIVDTVNGISYIFNEHVSWIYPDPSTLQQQTELAKEFSELQLKKQEVGTNIELLNPLLSELQNIELKIQKINKSLEPDVLIGRPFFDNFKYITFWHHDRKREHECYFEYELNPEKISDTKPIAKK